MSFTLAKTIPSRWVGKFDISKDSPTIVLLSGIHGNENTGVKAIEDVFKTIDEKKIPLLGNIYGLRGNLKAIEKEERYIDMDLNRAWTEYQIRKFKKNKTISEGSEVIELKGILDTFINEAKAPLYFVDLHTTSSHSPPFVILDDTIRNRNFAKILPATNVLGILEKLKGTILGYYGDKGPVTLVFEAGQHDELSSLHRHKAAIWLLLCKSGVIDPKNISIKDHLKTIQESLNDAPKVVQTTYRHVLNPSDDFQMKEGFSNFSPLTKGEVLAHQNGSPIKAKESAYIFMPLYQKKGEDGFFIVKKIAPFWVHLSKLLRKLKVENMLSLFPGIKLDSTQPDRFIVNKKLASFKSIELLHLFGFRKEREQGNLTIVSRRPYDFKGPWD